jgi:hypothetical protein
MAGLMGRRGNFWRRWKVDGYRKMSIVVIYFFTGQYAGASEYEWRHPEIGVTHKCFLFLRQQADTDEYDLALSELHKFGFADVAFSRRGKLQVEALNSDLYRGFSGFYETALSDGSCVVYYPNQVL